MARTFACAVAARCAAGVLAVVLTATAAQAAPIIPTIDTIDIGFGTHALSYTLNGTAPDRLVSTTDGVGGEATTVWYPWPGGMPTPLWYDLGVKNDNQFAYGADVRLDIIFTGNDDGGAGLVSLTGTGGKGPGIADFEIWGYLSTGTSPIPDGPNVLLWAIDLGNVALYGYGNTKAYVLEGVGTIVGGVLATELNLIDQLGAIRGHVDVSTFGPPAGYSPLSDYQGTFNLFYSGETGRTYIVPEPATISLLAIGGLGWIVRRRRSA